jgi:hypothetical protein
MAILMAVSKNPDAAKEPDEHAAWLKKENQAFNLLTQKLHDTTLTKLLALKTVAEWWTTIKTEFTVKSSHVVAAMRATFDKLKCADNGNVRTHLDKLRLKHEELIRVGITIPNDQLATRIIGSLPEHYQKHLATIEASARAATQAAAAMTLHHCDNTYSIYSISPDLLISLAIEEYDALSLSVEARGRAKEDTGVALSVVNRSASRSGQNSSRGRGKSFTSKPSWSLLELWGSWACPIEVSKPKTIRW